MLMLILLMAGLETCAKAVATGVDPSAHVARVVRASAAIGNGSEISAFENAETTQVASESTFQTWYRSEIVHNARLVLAGALGFLLVLLAVHLLSPSSPAEQARGNDSSGSGPMQSGCIHREQSHPNNTATAPSPTAGMNVGNFLPLGISLNHLNEIGQRAGGESGTDSQQYDELTKKIATLEDMLSQLTSGSQPQRAAKRIPKMWQRQLVARRQNSNARLPLKVSNPMMSDRCRGPDRMPRPQLGADRKTPVQSRCLTISFPKHSQLSTVNDISAGNCGVPINPMQAESRHPIFANYVVRRIVQFCDNRENTADSICQKIAVRWCAVFDVCFLFVRDWRAEFPFYANQKEAIAGNKDRFAYRCSAGIGTKSVGWEPDSERSAQVGCHTMEGRHGLRSFGRYTFGRYTFGRYIFGRYI